MSDEVYTKVELQGDRNQKLQLQITVTLERWYYLCKL